MKIIQLLEKDIINCELCPRLRTYCKAIAIKKKREFNDWDYWAKPVPGFGDHKARLWILGLAPAAHGANRTGRMFTGDSSGDWLYRALYKIGLANKEISKAKDDGLLLNNVYISSTIRCAPPKNKPNPDEILNCRQYLNREFQMLKNVRLFLALGRIGFQSTLSLLQNQGVEITRPAPKFIHGALYEFGKYTLLCSYHPSRQNTQTKLLTEPMWTQIFTLTRDLLDETEPHETLKNHSSGEGNLVTSLRSD